MFTLLIVVVVVGYLLGSLPFGYVVARIHGVDIFKAGSGNPGATNVRRVVGKGPGNVVFLLDAGKGAVAALVPGIYRAVANNTAGAWLPTLQQFQGLVAAALLSAVIGHSFSCFTKFRGGKGVATGAGGFAILFPSGMGIGLVIFILTVALTRFVSLGSVLAAVSLPVTALIQGAPPVILWVSVAVALLVVIRHRGNLARIFAGTEPKLGQGGKSSG